MILTWNIMKCPTSEALTELPGLFDAVAISSFSAQIKEAYCLADRYRAVGTKVVLGGLHVSAIPGEAAQHADSVVVGEGEPSWPALLSDLRGGRSRAIYDSRNKKFRSGRRSDAGFPPSGCRQIQPHHGADPAWLPLGDVTSARRQFAFPRPTKSNRSRR